MSLARSSFLRTVGPTWTNWPAAGGTATAPPDPSPTSLHSVHNWCFHKAEPNKFWNSSVKTCWLTSRHRLNMELDLQSLFGLLWTAVLIGLDPVTLTPRIWAHIRGRYLVSKGRRHLFVTPCFQASITKVRHVTFRASRIRLVFISGSVEKGVQHCFTTSFHYHRLLPFYTQFYDVLSFQTDANVGTCSPNKEENQELTWIFASQNFISRRRKEQGPNPYQSTRYGCGTLKKVNEQSIDIWSACVSDCIWIQLESRHGFWSNIFLLFLNSVLWFRIYFFRIQIRGSVTLIYESGSERPIIKNYLRFQPDPDPTWTFF